MQIHQQFISLYKFAKTATPHVISGLLVFIVIYIAALIVQWLIIRMANHSKKRKYLLRLLGKTSKVTIIIIGIVSALGTMGINITAMVTGLGLVGFAMGFALKDFLSNIIAGFMLLFYHPFQVNDNITLSGASGTVVDINLRYTTIHTEGISQMVPNSTLITSIVTIQQEHSQ